MTARMPRSSQAAMAARESVSPFCSLAVRSDAGCCTIAARLLWRRATLNVRLQIDEFCENAGGFGSSLDQPGIWGPLVARGRRRLAAVERRRKSVRRLPVMPCQCAATRTLIEDRRAQDGRDRYFTVPDLQIRSVSSYLEPSCTRGGARCSKSAARRVLELS